MTRFIERFSGRELFAGGVWLSIFDTHIELTIEGAPEGVGVKVPYDELGPVLVEDVLGNPTLVIEDDAGILVAALGLEAEEARRADALVEWLRARPQTRADLERELRSA
jgi:hypothetical protein